METWQSTIGTTVSFWECVSWKVQIGGFSGSAAVAPTIGYKSHVEMFPAHKRPRCCPDIFRCFDIVQGPVVLGIPWWQVIQHCWGAETTVAASCFVSCGRFRCCKIGIHHRKSPPVYFHKFVDLSMPWILSTHPAGSLTFLFPVGHVQGTLNSSMVQAEYPKRCGPAPNGAVIPGEEIHLRKFFDIYLIYSIYHLSRIIDQNLSRIICQLVLYPFSMNYYLFLTIDYPPYYHLSSIIYHWSSIIYHPSPIVYQLSPVTYHLSSIVYHLSSIIYHLSSAICYLFSVIYYLLSIVYNLQSII